MPSCRAVWADIRLARGRGGPTDEQMRDAEQQFFQRWVARELSRARHGYQYNVASDRSAGRCARAAAA